MDTALGRVLLSKPRFYQKQSMSGTSVAFRPCRLLTVPTQQLKITPLSSESSVKGTALSVVFFILSGPPSLSRTPADADWEIVQWIAA